jgi:hypothetical protein
MRPNQASGHHCLMLGRTPMQMEFANDATLLLPSATQLCIEVPQDNQLVASRSPF